MPHAQWALAGLHGGTPLYYGRVSTALVMGVGAYRSHSTRVFPQPARLPFETAYIVIE